MPTTATGSAGTVDANGILWKSSQVGKCTDSFEGCANLYDTLAASAKKNGDRPAAGLRPVVESQMVGGFEKLKMATHFEWLTYAPGGSNAVLVVPQPGLLGLILQAPTALHTRDEQQSRSRSNLRCGREAGGSLRF